MSMRDFLDGECGQNPVLKVATHFTRDSLSSDLGQSSRHAFVSSTVVTISKSQVLFI